MKKRLIISCLLISISNVDIKAAQTMQKQTPTEMKKLSQAKATAQAHLKVAAQHMVSATMKKPTAPTAHSDADLTAQDSKTAEEHVKKAHKVLSKATDKETVMQHLRNMLHDIEDVPADVKNWFEEKFHEFDHKGTDFNKERKSFTTHRTSQKKRLVSEYFKSDPTKKAPEHVVAKLNAVDEAHGAAVAKVNNNIKAEVVATKKGSPSMLKVPASQGPSSQTRKTILNKFETKTNNLSVA